MKLNRNKNITVTVSRSVMLFNFSPFHPLSTFGSGKKHNNVPVLPVLRQSSNLDKLLLPLAFFYQGVCLQHPRIQDPRVDRAQLVTALTFFVLTFPGRPAFCYLGLVGKLSRFLGPASLTLGSRYSSCSS